LQRFRNGFEQDVTDVYLLDITGSERRGRGGGMSKWEINSNQNESGKQRKVKKIYAL